MQKSDLLSDDVGKFDEAGVEGIDAALGEIFEETAQGNEVIRLSDSFK